ncbi:MAG: hypothetical protein WBA13_20235 [Microcoleaceae cyanobacterium]
MLKLGQILVEKRLISSAQLQDVIQLQILGQKKLGEILVLQGAIRPQDLQTALQDQIEQQSREYQLKSQILTWQIVEDIYQATYGDELGLFIFRIIPEKSEQFNTGVEYLAYCQLQLFDEIVMNDDCGTAATLEAAQQLAEEKLLELL